ncbi:MAG: Ig-like domain-containing protein [Bermanella sp.]
MLKKSLLSLAVTASLVGLAGCNISSTADNNEVDTTGIDVGTPEYIEANKGTVSTTYAIFNPSRATPVGLRETPVISDLLFQGSADADCTDADSDGLCDANGKATTDGTIPLAQGNPGLADDGYNPIFSAAADLDGFSTTGQIDIPFSAAIDGTSLVTSGTGANVILIPLDYDDPITGTLQAGTFKSSGPAAIEATAITYASGDNNAVSGQGNILRISPTTPLLPKTRYLIVVTDGIKDASGLPVKGSNTYKALTADFTFLIGDDASTQSKIALSNTLKSYQSLAEGYAAAAGYTYSKEDIVYSFSFTTGGTTSVLDAMAAPANFVESAVEGKGASFNIPLPAKYRYTLETNIDGDPANIPAAANAVWAQLDADSGDANPVVAGTANAVLTALGADQTAQVISLNGLGAIHNAIPSPAPRLSDFTSTIDAAADDGAGDALNLDTLLGAALTGGTGRVANGTIKLPYYGGIPNLAANPLTAAYVLNKWDADDSLEADLGAVLTGAGVSEEQQALFTPPSTNVTRLFPIAKPQGFLETPVSVIYSTACAGEYTPVIFQHGITSNRSSSFGVAASLFAEDPCLATVAIDLPMHGLTNEDDAGLLALLTAEDQSDQRHFGLTINPLTLQPKAMTGTGDQSGSLFIQLLSFQGTRDNMRQAVMDLMNLNASLDFMDFTDNNAGTDFDVSKVHFVGHSLGAILGTTFVAVNNSQSTKVTAGSATHNAMLPNITTATLANGGGQVTKLLENSNIGTSLVIPGLAALGTNAGLDLGQGSSLFELTLQLFQATVDSADPINFAAKLKATNTPVLAFEIAGNTDNPSDQTVPVDAVDSRLAPALPAPLAGTEPLVSELGLVSTSADIAAGTDPVQAIVRFNNGVHSSFAGISDDGEDGSATTVFTEMMTQLKSFIGGDGKALDVSDTNVIVSSAE